MNFTKPTIITLVNFPSPYFFNPVPILEHSENEDLFYVLLPKDIILARTRDLDDRLTWLLERNRCESAFFLAQESENRGNKSKREEYTAQSIGQIYLGQLIEQGLVIVKEKEGFKKGLNREF